MFSILSNPKSKQVKQYRDLLEKLKKDNDYNLENLNHQLLFEVSENLVNEKIIQNFALEELYTALDDLKNKQYPDILKLVDDVFKNTENDGTITHFLPITENILFSNYSMDKIIDKGNKLSTNNPEYILIDFIKDELISNLKKYPGSPIAKAITYLKDNGYKVNYQIKEDKMADCYIIKDDKLIDYHLNEKEEDSQKENELEM